MHSRTRTNTRTRMCKRRFLMTTTMLRPAMTSPQSPTITTTIAQGIVRSCCPACLQMRTLT